MAKEIDTKEENSQDATDYQVTGDYPAYIESIPGVIRIDDSAGPAGLREKAEAYLQAFPQIKTGARRTSQDLVAFARNHGREILVGAGVASLVTGAAVGGIILYKHKHRK